MARSLTMESRWLPHEQGGMIGAMRLDGGQIEVMDAAMVDVYRRKTPAERIAICDGMWRFAEQVTRAGIRHQYPEWSHDQVEREAVRRLSHGAIGTAEQGGKHP